MHACMYENICSILYSIIRLDIELIEVVCVQIMNVNTSGVKQV